jgi:hypothetical protein
MCLFPRGRSVYSIRSSTVGDYDKGDAPKGKKKTHVLDLLTLFRCRCVGLATQHGERCGKSDEWHLKLFGK